MRCIHQHHNYPNQRCSVCFREKQVGARDRARDWFYTERHKGDEWVHLCSGNSRQREHPGDEGSNQRVDQDVGPSTDACSTHGKNTQQSLGTRVLRGEPSDVVKPAPMFDECAQGYISAATSSVAQTSSYTDKKTNTGGTSGTPGGMTYSTSLGTTVKQRFYDILSDLDLSLCGRGSIPHPSSSHSARSKWFLLGVSAMWQAVNLYLGLYPVHIQVHNRTNI